MEVLLTIWVDECMYMTIPAFYPVGPTMDCYWFLSLSRSNFPIANTNTVCWSYTHTWFDSTMRKGDPDSLVFGRIRGRHGNGGGEGFLFPPPTCVSPPIRPNWWGMQGGKGKRNLFLFPPPTCMSPHICPNRREPSLDETGIHFWEKSESGTVTWQWSM